MQDHSFRTPARSRATGTATLILLACLMSIGPQLLAQNAAPPAKVHRKIVTMFEPDYPYVLRNGHFQGQVRLDATVLPNGSVSKVEVKGGNPMLAQYGVLAVMRWKYVPGPAQTVEEVVFAFNPDK